MVYFDGLIETILAVGLVKPKEGMSCFSSKHAFCHIVSLKPPKYLLFVFFCHSHPSGILQPHIHYLLVLATSVDVVILGLSFPKNQASEFHSIYFSANLLLKCSTLEFIY